MQSSLIVGQAVNDAPMIRFCAMERKGGFWRLPEEEHTSDAAVAEGPAVHLKFKEIHAGWEIPGIQGVIIKPGRNGDAEEGQDNPAEGIKYGQRRFTADRNMEPDACRCVERVGKVLIECFQML
jgi:hypothetical protein